MEARTETSPVDPAVSSIVAELRRRLEAIYGDRLVAMLLYGSQARGDPEPGSDIDVLVALRGPVDPGEEILRTLNTVAELSLEKNETIACLFLSEEDYAREQSPFMLSVRREGVRA